MVNHLETLFYGWQPIGNPGPGWGADLPCNPPWSPGREAAGPEEHGRRDGDDPVEGHLCHRGGEAAGRERQSLQPPGTGDPIGQVKGNIGST